MNKIMVMIFSYFLLTSSSFASIASGDVYSVGSIHGGSSGSVLEGGDFSSRSTLTYQQGGDKDANSTIYFFNLGWFKQVNESSGGLAVEEVVPDEGEDGLQVSESVEVLVVEEVVSDEDRILFDVDILGFESPVRLGDFFDFTYFIKGVGNIDDDVTINFWIEKEGEIVTSGSTVIYMGRDEEKIGTASLFLAEDIVSGNYKFVVQASFQGVKGEAHREIELELKDGEVIIISLFDISFSLDDPVIGSSDELLALISFENFGSGITVVNLTFTILDNVGNVIYEEDENVTVITEISLRKRFEGLNLSEGEYTLVFTTLYGDAVFDEFRQDFEIVFKEEGFGLVTGLFSVLSEGRGFNMWILFLVILIIILVIWYFKKKKTLWKRNNVYGIQRKRRVLLVLMKVREFLRVAQKKVRRVLKEIKIVNVKKSSDEGRLGKNVYGVQRKRGVLLRLMKVREFLRVTLKKVRSRLKKTLWKRNNVYGVQRKRRVLLELMRVREFLRVTWKKVRRKLK